MQATYTSIKALIATYVAERTQNEHNAMCGYDYRDSAECAAFAAALAAIRTIVDYDDMITAYDMLGLGRAARDLR